MSFLLPAALLGLGVVAAEEMNRTPAVIRQPLPVCLAQIVGITAPAMYSSLTFAYSHAVVPPLAAHAPEKLLARQWIQAYQFASVFIPPLVLSGTLSNVYLAYRSPSLGIRTVYGAAAVLVFSIIPWTLLYFEPNINGSGKWKVQELLQDEGYDMKPQTGPLPSPYVHTATLEARGWAKSVSMKEIVLEWGRLNARRYIATAVAMVLSAAATCGWLSGGLS